MSHSKKIFKNSFFSLFSKIVTICIGFITRKVFISFLSAELLGLNSLFTDLLGLLNLADLGFGVALQFNLYKFIAQNNKEKIARLLNAAKRLYNIAGMAMIVAGIGVSFFVQYLIKDNPYPIDFIRVVFIITVLSSASSYFFVHKRLFMQACEEIHITDIIDIISNVVCSILKIVVIVVFKNYYIYLIIGVLQSIASNFMVSYLCDKRYAYLKEIKGYTKAEMNALMENIKDLVPSKISNYIFFNTDNTIISSFLGLASVTLYTNYSSIVAQIYLITVMIAGVMKVSFGNLLQENSDKSRQMHFLNSYQMLEFFYSSFCATALLCLLNTFVGFWYGEEFVLPMIIVFLLTIDFYIHSMYQPLSMMIEVLGEFEELKKQDIFTMITNIVVSIGLIFKFGLVGPIVGTLVVDIIVTFFRVNTVVKKHYAPYLKDYVKKMMIYVGIFAVEYVVTYCICDKIIISSAIIAIIVKGIICFAVTFGLNIVLLSKTDEFYYLKSKFFK